MSAFWMTAAVLCAVVVAAVVTSLWRRHDDTDLGSVSHTWIAEQRFGHSQLSRR